jgi:hypothetical protein
MHFSTASLRRTEKSRLAPAFAAAVERIGSPGLVAIETPKLVMKLPSSVTMVGARVRNFVYVPFVRVATLAFLSSTVMARPIFFTIVSNPLVTSLLVSKGLLCRVRFGLVWQVHILMPYCLPDRLVYARPESDSCPRFRSAGAASFRRQSRLTIVMVYVVCH